MKSLSLKTPHLLVVVGLPGAGKTFFAQQFSKTFGAPYLELAMLRHLSGDDKSAGAIWQHMLEQLIQTKQTLIVEGGGDTKIERRELAAFARKRGYEPLFIWVQTELPTAKARATRGVGGKKPLTTRSATDFDYEVGQFEPLLVTESYTVISGKHTYASQAKNILKKLTEPQLSERTAQSAPKRQQAPSIAEARPGRITVN